MQGTARAGAGVIRAAPVHSGTVDDDAVVRKDVRGDFAAVRIEAHGDAVGLGRREDHFGRQVVHAPVLRVRPLPRRAQAACAAGVVGFVAGPARVEHHAGQCAALAGQIEGGHRAAVRARIAALERRGERVLLREPIARILRRQRHHAAEGVAAPQCGDGAAGDLGVAQAVDVHVVAARAQERPERELLRHAHAVDKREHAVAADAANGNARQTEPAAGAGHADARLEPHQIRDVPGQLLLQLLVRLHRDGGGHFPHAPLGARRHDGEDLGRPGTVLVRLFRQRCRRRQHEGRPDGQRAGGAARHPAQGGAAPVGGQSCEG